MSAALQQVYLVRHGETAWSLSGQATGRTDLPLIAQGERAARELGAHLKGISFEQVLTSPLQRARRTADLAGFAKSAQVDADLTEWDYGAYEGRRTEDIRAERPGWRLFKDGCPGGEALAEASKRADRVIDRIRALSGNALVFAHWDILRIIAVRWLGLQPAKARYFFLTTASISILGYHHGLDEPVIHLWNDTRHR